MAENKNHEGFPKIFVKGEGATRSTRLASTPADAVNLAHRGYAEDETGTKDYQAAVEKDSAKTEASNEGGADSASAVAGSAEAPVTDAEPKAPSAEPKASSPRPTPNRN